MCLCWSGSARGEITAAQADFDGSGVVDIADFLQFVDAYGSQAGQSAYQTKFDLDGDGTVGISDFLLFVNVFGQTAGPNQPPIAHAGEDQSVDKRETVTLNGANSSDPEGQPLTFTWRQIEGEQVTLSDSKIARPTMSTLDPGRYAFELVVNDGVASSIPDTVVVDIVSIAAVAVKVGSPDASFAYKETTGNQMTFTIQGTAPPVQIGAVMVNTVEPYFLKKVTGVISQNANEVVVMTEDAALTDVIEEANIRWEFSDPATKISLADSPPSASNITLHNDTQASLRVTKGDLSFSRKHEIEIDIEYFTVKYFKAGIKGDISSLLEMELIAKSSFSLHANKKIGPTLGPYISYIPVAWFVVPVAVTLDFGVGADFTAEASGSVTAGISIKKPYSLGIEYKNGRVAKPKRDF